MIQEAAAGGLGVLPNKDTRSVLLLELRVSLQPRANAHLWKGQPSGWSLCPWESGDGL